MNRLVRVALNNFIRAGNLRITTARGAAYDFGDASGEPVAIRFTTCCFWNERALYRRAGSGTADLDVI